LPSPVINDLLETRAGEYWVATDSGICRFNPNGTATRYAVNISPESKALQHSNSKAQSAPMFTVFSPAGDEKSKATDVLFQDRAGTIWCGTQRGLYRLEEQNEQVAFAFIDLGLPPVYGESSNITALLEDRIGSLWIGSISGIYRRFGMAGSRTMAGTTTCLGLRFTRCSRIVTAGFGWELVRVVCFRVQPDPDPARPLIARRYSTKDGVPTWINQLFQTSDGGLWAGSNYGLVRFLPTADGDFRFRVYGQAHGLSSNQVQALAEDANGNLWVGLANGGAAKLARSGITSFGDSDGFSSATAIFKDHLGDLYVLGASLPRGPRLFEEPVINKLEGERFTPLHLRFPRKTYWAWGWNQLVLEDHKGEWWVATDRGLLRYPRVASFDLLARTPPKAVYTTHDGLASGVILRVFEDARGDIWIGEVNGVNGHGLSRWERSTETFHHYTETDGLPSLKKVYPISFAEDRTGAVWIGFSVGGGLVRYRDGQFTSFNAAAGLPEGGVFNLFIDSQGRLWAPTTRGGVCRIDHPEADHPALLTYNTGNGLSSNDVKAIAEDRWQRIYLSTGRGIDRLDLTTGQVRHYTANEGAPLGNANAALQDRDGALWFSYATGLIRLVPEPDLPPVPAPVLITGLRVAGSMRGISALGESKSPFPDLAANQNEIQIEFVGLNFAPGDTPALSVQARRRRLE
jgi:ligand-binding sensor domain-containing protein